MKKFEQLVKYLFELTLEYAVSNLKLDHTSENPKDWSAELQNKFTEYIYIGFRKAQTIVLKELLKNERLLKKMNEDLSCSRLEKNNRVGKRIKQNMDLLYYKNSILRSFMDYIAWQFLQGQYHNTRRFYDMGQKKNIRPTLSTSNIKSVASVVEYYHNLSPLNFALISDLTSFVAIGDILLMNNYKLIPIEVKEGKTNEEILAFLDEVGKEKISTCPYSLVSNFDKNFIKQTQRVIRQKERMHKLTDFLNNEEGVDPFTNLKITVNKEGFEFKEYSNEINDAIGKLEEDNFSYSGIEDIIFIGLYKGKFSDTGKTLVPLLNRQLFNKDFPVFNFRQKFAIPVTQPIFYLGLSKKTILDIFNKRINIVISINLDNFINLCNANGLHARFLTKKETIKRKQNGEISMFEWEGQNIYINENIILGDGMIARMVFDFVKPSSIIQYLKQYSANYNTNG